MFYLQHVNFFIGRISTRGFWYFGFVGLGALRMSVFVILMITSSKHLIFDFAKILVQQRPRVTCRYRLRHGRRSQRIRHHLLNHIESQSALKAKIAERRLVLPTACCGFGSRASRASKRATTAIGEEQAHGRQGALTEHAKELIVRP